MRTSSFYFGRCHRSFDIALAARKSFCAMNGSAIQPYDNVWLVTVHYPDGRVVERGLSTDHVRFIRLGGMLA